jgi:hypothetical protein
MAWKCDGCPRKCDLSSSFHSLARSSWSPCRGVDKAFHSIMGLEAILPLIVGIPFRVGRPLTEGRSFTVPRHLGLQNKGGLHSWVLCRIPGLEWCDRSICGRHCPERNRRGSAMRRCPYGSGDHVVRSNHAPPGHLDASPIRNGSDGRPKLRRRISYLGTMGVTHSISVTLEERGATWHFGNVGAKIRALVGVLVGVLVGGFVGALVGTFCRASLIDTNNINTCVVAILHSSLAYHKL